MYCPRCASPCTFDQSDSFARNICYYCGYVEYRNPAPCVSVLVVDGEDRFLLGKRTGRVSYPNLWCLPCGHIEYEESFVDAAVRETKEETGILIRPAKIINVVSNQLANQKHSLVVVLLAFPLTTTIFPSDDITDARWQRFKDKLPEMAFEADIHIIEKYRKERENFGIALSDTVISFCQNNPTG